MFQAADVTECSLRKQGVQGLAVCALAALATVLTDAASTAVPALAASATVLTDAASTAVLARAALATMWTFFPFPLGH